MREEVEGVLHQQEAFVLGIRLVSKIQASLHSVQRLDDQLLENCESEGLYCDLFICNFSDRW